MKNLGILALAALSAAGVGAQEVGRVISSTPVIQQVSVPRQSCANEVVPGQKSGGGALMGAIAGGAAGNAIGDGSGRAAATVLGLFAGAILGDRIEGGGQPQNVQRCVTQNFIENRTVAYNVVYEYNGKQYQVQMPRDPGPTVTLQVTPVGANPPEQEPDVAAVPSAPAPMYAPVPGWPNPQYGVPVVVQAPPVVYVHPYRAPVFTSISISGGRHHGHRPHHPHVQPWPHHGHWR